MQESFGPFTLLTKLAEGGMAATYLGRVTGDAAGSELVIKRILPKLIDDKELSALFEEEARVAVELDHPQIVRLFQYGQAEGEHYLAMEYVWGEDLRRIAEAGGRANNFLPLPIAVHVVAQAARGLSYFHALNDDAGRPLALVHRDVSPPNLMVTYDGHVKVVDFGIAKAESHHTNVRQGQLKGKFSYMSPEQVQGLEVDNRSDLFSLGTILYELTTMKRLFKAESDILTVKLVSQAKVEAPTLIKPSYSSALEAVVLRTLALEPDDRYQTGDELADALDAFLAAEGLTPSADDVAAYMQGLFADRLSELNGILGVEYNGPKKQPVIPDTAAIMNEEDGALDDLIDDGGSDAGGGADFDDDFGMDPSPGDGGKVLKIMVGVVVALLGAFLIYTVATDGFSPDVVGDTDFGETFDEFGGTADIPPPVRPPLTSMMVTSTPPGAWVVVNGVAASAQTPARIEVVQNATNTISLFMHGHETIHQNVDIATEGQPLEVALTEIVMPADWTPPPPPPPLAEGEEPPEIPPVIITEWSLPVGHIMVQTTTPGGPLEGATVLLNGEVQEGATPLEIEVTARQEQHITVQYAGHRDSVAFVRSIPWDSFEDTRYFSLELTADREESNIYSTLRIDSNPQESTIVLNGEDQGTLGLLNMPYLGHYLVEVTAPDHDDWVRAFDATVGIVEINAMMTRPRQGATLLTINVEPDGTTIFTMPVRHGSPGYTQIGRDFAVMADVEAGPYSLRFANREGEERIRVDVEHTFVPGTHHRMVYDISSGEAVLLEQIDEPIPENWEEMRAEQLTEIQEQMLEELERMAEEAAEAAENQ